MILFVDACVRTESRTRRLAEYLLKKLDGEVCPLVLAEQEYPAVDEAFLGLRERLADTGDLDHGALAFARMFAAADTVVVEAPYWELSFPAALKQYVEQINVTGVTFAYSPEGIPQGLCRAKCLYYVTTAGGPILSDDYGYGYIEALAKGYWGIPETVLIRAEGLDLPGADVEEILRGAERSADDLCEAR